MDCCDCIDWEIQTDIYCNLHIFTMALVNTLAVLVLAWVLHLILWLKGPVTYYFSNLKSRKKNMSVSVVWICRYRYLLLKSALKNVITLEKR